MKVNEIFSSIQGEGAYAGYPALFIRLSRCNRSCNFCDTKYHKEGKEMSITEIKEIVDDSKYKTIVVSGGEPLLRLAELRDLIKICKSKDWCLETNGDLITEKNIGLLCDLFWYICVSPKDKRTTKKCHKLFYERHILSDYSSAYKTRFDIKVVTDLKMNRSLFDYATCLMPLTISVNDIESGTNDRYVIVQQMNQEIRQRVWNYCVKHNIRYSSRLHVEVWGPKRGV